MAEPRAVSGMTMAGELFGVKAHQRLYGMIYNIQKLRRYRIRLDKDEYTDELGLQYTSYTVTSPDIAGLIT
jgi:hypothetical protein